ncbi:MAG: Crp/Fnr family transcriptional regulator [Acidobacteriota bacterium]
MPDALGKDDLLDNVLLAALPTSELEKIRGALEPVSLEQGDALWEVEDPTRYLYFPTTSIIALMHETDGGISAGVGIVGRDGVVGLEIFMEEAQSSERAIVQVEGSAYRMKAKAVKDEFARCGDFQEILLCYTQAMIAQIAQTAVCNRLHNVEQQLCRWFLTNCHDQKTNTFSMTHDQISNYLGVRRETVSLAAAELQNRGIIEYSRGKITIVDQDLLEGAACECFGEVKAKYDQMMNKYTAQHA